METLAQKLHKLRSMYADKPKLKPSVSHSSLVQSIKDDYVLGTGTEEAFIQMILAFAARGEIELAYWYCINRFSFDLDKNLEREYEYSFQHGYCVCGNRISYPSLVYHCVRCCADEDKRRLPRNILHSLCCWFSCEEFVIHKSFFRLMEKWK